MNHKRQVKVRAQISVAEVEVSVVDERRVGRTRSPCDSSTTCFHSRGREAGVDGEGVSGAEATPAVDEVGDSPRSVQGTHGESQPVAHRRFRSLGTEGRVGEVGTADATAGGRGDVAATDQGTRSVQGGVPLDDLDGVWCGDATGRGRHWVR